MLARLHRELLVPEEAGTSRFFHFWYFHGSPSANPMTDTALSVRDAYLHQFLEDTLEIPCVRIRLTQLTEHDPLVYEAPGTLRLGKSFGLKCDLKVPTPGNSIEDAFAQLSHWEKQELGQLVLREEYFELEAVTTEGVYWTCQHVSVIARPGQDACAVHFEASYVENISHVEESAFFARLTYIEDLRLPKNHRVDEMDRSGRRFVGRDGSRGRLANLDLTYARRFRDESVARGELTVHATEGHVPPRHFDVRIEETILFCSALLVRPVCTEVAYGKLRSILFAKHRPVHAGIASPPLQDRAAEQDFYKLATAYYEHACKDGDVELMSQLTRKIGGLFDMSGASIAAVALQLSVAVEALAQTGPLRAQVMASPQLRTVAKSVKSRLLNMRGLDALSKHFAAANKGPDQRSLRERLDALLNGLSSGGRTVDVLKLLENAGTVKASEIKAWNELRHAAAHGSWEPREEQMQVHFDDLYKVMTLVYRLVFVHIGYEGMFSERSTRGWPTATFNGKNVKAVLKLE